jgi:hypothetical protein
MWTRLFWQAAAERSLKTAAQVVLVGVGDDILNINALELNYAELGGLALGGALVSVLTSLVSSRVGNSGPSLTTEELDVPRATPPSPSQRTAGYDEGTGRFTV